MSQETSAWATQNFLVGMGVQSWHMQPVNTNHFDGPVPLDRVKSMFTFPLELTEVHMPLADGTTVVATDRRAVVRTDTRDVFYIGSDTYKIHDYTETLLVGSERILDASIESGDLGIATAGLAKKGAIAWVSFAMSEPLNGPGGILFRPYLMATTSLDGSIASTWKRGFTLPVCDNTREQLLAEDGEYYAIKHTINSELRPIDARQALNIIQGLGDSIDLELRAMVEQSVSDSQWEAFLNLAVKLPDDKGRARTIAEGKRDSLSGLWTSDLRVAPWKNTAFGVVQAVNTYDQHLSRINSATDRAERNMIDALGKTSGASDRATYRMLQLVL